MANDEGNDPSHPQSPATIGRSHELEIVHTVEWAGPLPAPEILAEYAEVVPNGAERIIRQFEAEGEHRRWSERNSIRNQLIADLSGKVIGLIFALAALGVAAFCAWLGHSGAAAVIGGATIAATVGALVYRPKDE